MTPLPRPSLLLIDNYDSFTYNLWDYFLQLGAACQVVRNDEVDLESVQEERYDALVLSPGPGKPTDAGKLMACVEAFHSRIPILGICLGHQAIGSFFGARLVKARRPVHGKTSVCAHNGNFLFEGLPSQFSVMRYHSLILEDLPEELECTAWTETGEVMALQHRQLPLTGIQFHPESILTPHGLTMLRNWVKDLYVF
ncbi:MAG: aminodeoxychorismate/anthranilate synthase component II [Lewinellaceae bacterium]|nr:aminodeoxychorismate/anthranilate synthase component II [Lewinellaceae bacterium]